MVAHPFHLGIRCEIISNGEPLKEYEAEAEKSKHLDPKIAEHEDTFAVTKYIESASGEAYKIQVTVDKSHRLDSPSLLFLAFIDGEKVEGPVLTRAVFDLIGEEWSDFVDGAVVGNKLRPFLFSKISITSKDRSAEETKQLKERLSKVGEIVVKVFRQDSGGQAIFDEDTHFREANYDTEISEVALKGKVGDVSHGTSLGAARPAQGGAWWLASPTDGLDKPIALFCFKYRSKETLDKCSMQEDATSYIIDLTEDIEQTNVPDGNEATKQDDEQRIGDLHTPQDFPETLHASVTTRIQRTVVAMTRNLHSRFFSQDSENSRPTSEIVETNSSTSVNQGAVATESSDSDSGIADLAFASPGANGGTEMVDSGKNKTGEVPSETTSPGTTAVCSSLGNGGYVPNPENADARAASSVVNTANTWLEHGGSSSKPVPTDSAQSQTSAEAAASSNAAIGASAAIANETRASTEAADIFRGTSTVKVEDSGELQPRAQQEMEQGVLSIPSAKFEDVKSDGIKIEKTDETGDRQNDVAELDVKDEIKTEPQIVSQGFKRKAQQPHIRRPMKKPRMMGKVTVIIDLTEADEDEEKMRNAIVID